MGFQVQASVYTWQAQWVGRKSRLQMGQREFPVVREPAEELQSEVRLAVQVKQPTPPASLTPRPFDILIEE